MQGTWVRALVWEDPTCRGATKPVRCNYWACALEPTSHNYGAHVLQLLKPTHLEPVLCNERGHHSENPTHHSEEWPLLATTRESPHAAAKTQCSQKINKFKKKDFLKTHTYTHTTKYLFCIKEIKIFNSPKYLEATICILTWFLFIFLKLLHIFFMESKISLVCHLFVCFTRKLFIETRFQMGFSQDFS